MEFAAGFVIGAWAATAVGGFVQGAACLRAHQRRQEFLTALQMRERLASLTRTSQEVPKEWRALRLRVRRGDFADDMVAEHAAYDDR